MTAIEANRISKENAVSDLQFYLNSIEDRAKRGLYVAAFNFIPKDSEVEIRNLGFLVSRKQDNYIEVSWYDKQIGLI